MAKRPHKIQNNSTSRPIVIFVLSIVGVLYFAFTSFSSSLKSLPPTDIVGHVEEIPPSHVLKEPMPISVQKHMLEHADGVGLPGVIINYDCESYSCAPDLVKKLESFATKYSNVYVSPYKNMASKIAVTKYGKIITLDDFNENIINSFILST